MSRWAVVQAALFCLPWLQRFSQAATACEAQLLALDDASLWYLATEGRRIGMYCHIVQPGECTSSCACDLFVSGRGSSAGDFGLPRTPHGHGSGCVIGENYQGLEYELTDEERQAMVFGSNESRALAQLRWGIRHGYCEEEGNPLEVPSGGFQDANGVVLGCQTVTADSLSELAGGRLLTDSMDNSSENHTGDNNTDDNVDCLAELLALDRDALWPLVTDGAKLGTYCYITPPNEEGCTTYGVFGRPDATTGEKGLPRSITGTGTGCAIGHYYQSPQYPLTDEERNSMVLGEERDRAASQLRWGMANGYCQDVGVPLCGPGSEPMGSNATDNTTVVDCTETLLSLEGSVLFGLAMGGTRVGTYCYISQPDEECTTYGVFGRPDATSGDKGLPRSVTGTGSGCSIGHYYQSTAYPLTDEEREIMVFGEDSERAAAQLRWGIRNGYCEDEGGPILAPYGGFRDETNGVIDCRAPSPSVLANNNTHGGVNDDINTTDPCVKGLLALEDAVLFALATGGDRIGTYCYVSQATQECTTYGVFGRPDATSGDKGLPRSVTGTGSGCAIGHYYQSAAYPLTAEERQSMVYGEDMARAVAQLRWGIENGYCEQVGELLLEPDGGYKDAQGAVLDFGCRTNTSDDEEEEEDDNEDTGSSGPDKGSGPGGDNATDNMTNATTFPEDHTTNLTLQDNTTNMTNVTLLEGYCVEQLLALDGAALWPLATGGERIGLYCYVAQPDADEGCTTYGVFGEPDATTGEKGLPRSETGTGTGCAVGHYYQSSAYPLTDEERDSMVYGEPMERAVAQLRWGIANGYCGVRLCADDEGTIRTSTKTTRTFTTTTSVTTTMTHTSSSTATDDVTVTTSETSTNTATTITATATTATTTSVTDTTATGTTVTVTATTATEPTDTTVTVTATILAAEPTSCEESFLQMGDEILWALTTNGGKIGTYCHISLPGECLSCQCPYHVKGRPSDDTGFDGLPRTPDAVGNGCVLGYLYQSADYLLTFEERTSMVSGSLEERAIAQLRWGIRNGFCEDIDVPLSCGPSGSRQARLSAAVVLPLCLLLLFRS